MIEEIEDSSEEENKGDGREEVQEEEKKSLAESDENDNIRISCSMIASPKSESAIQFDESVTALENDIKTNENGKDD